MQDDNEKRLPPLEPDDPRYRDPDEEPIKGDHPDWYERRQKVHPEEDPKRDWEKGEEEQDGDYVRKDRPEKGE